MTTRIRSIDYEDAGTILRGQLVWNDAWTSPRPCVLVVHDAMKSDQGFEEERAVALTAEGFAAFALDVYGADVNGKDEAEAGALMAPFMSDRARLQARLRAGLEAARALPEVDGGRMAAIGYCFGGLCVLDLARAGADLAGVASFHGLLAGADVDLATPPDAPIAPRVLVFHGWDDAFVPPETVAPFAAEMSARGADWQLVAYGDTGHAFTNVRYGRGEGPDTTGYDARADARSWRTLVDFLRDLFPRVVPAPSTNALADDPRPLFLEDYAADFHVEGGQYIVTEAEILEFGRRFDPQPFHVDPEIAVDGPFGGLVAPGSLTFAIRQALSNQLAVRPALVAGLGLESMDLPNPVRPGDALSLSIDVVETRRSRSRPDTGIVKTRQRVANQQGEVVFEMVAKMIVRARDAEAKR